MQKIGTDKINYKDKITYFRQFLHAKANISKNMPQGHLQISQISNAKIDQKWQIAFLNYFCLFQIFAIGIVDVN